ncbi:MAG: DNA polymerase/3'-5' exonuclease PolX [Nitrospiraceae bacterium]|nr:DNA polymerase/3'-5' exonuclease PolX [Nitrospiraceae bacterium]
MKNSEIAEIFNRIADRLEIKGDNPFRIRAYRKAALNIETIPKSIYHLTDEELKKIPGIGHDLAEKISEYLKTGKIKTDEELKQELPDSLLSLLAVPGLGPKTAKLLHDSLHIKSLHELKEMALKNKLAGLPGIKEKTQENIIRGLEILEKVSERMSIGKALPIAEDITAALKEKFPSALFEIAGSLRRWKETVGDIDILAVNDNPEEIMDYFASLPFFKQILSHGPAKSSAVANEGIQVDIRVVSKGSYGAALLYFTGSKAHNVRLREMAVRMGIKVNEYGVFRENDDHLLAGSTEADAYKALGMQWVPPEIREDSGEIEAALGNTLPDLVKIEDIKGDLHVHSKWSDGSHSIEELADKAKELGYEYIAITDHTKSLGVAHGLSADQIIERDKKIDALNSKLVNLKLLKGAEVDIKSNGELDLPDEILSGLDFVIASIHSGFKQPREQLTSRLISAMQNPFVHAVGHLTGRLLGERNSYELDIEAIISTAKKTSTLLEINSYPLRLDIDDITARRASESGVRVVINTDAHILSNFDFMKYGVGIARRAWLTKKDVLNTLSLKKLKHVLRKTGQH